MLLLYHICFEMGRFPYELPAGLPDEQLVLMAAYVELRAELRSGKSTSDDFAGRAAEKRLQTAESVAWTNRRGVSNG